MYSGDPRVQPPSPSNWSAAALLGPDLVGADLRNRRIDFVKLFEVLGEVSF